MGPLRAALPEEPVTARLAQGDVADPIEMAGSAVWVDGTRAVVVRWAGHPILARVEDDVPSRHRSTGHIRHDPAVRHGGGGVLSEQLERDRLRHRSAHLRRVAALVPASGPVLVMGPGAARLELERILVAADRRYRRERSVWSEASGRLTDRELIARLRASIGAAPSRRIVGAARKRPGPAG